MKRYKYQVILALILVLATILRFYRLDYQSLWFDELYSVNEADPSLSWRQLLYYCQTDQHPPVYFILERLSFLVFGYTEWAARAVSAAAGVLCVLAMYFLGKEVADKRLGIIAAIILAANEYNIHFSHEARPYTLVWLLSAISSIFFLRVIRSLKLSDTILYVAFSILLIYTNYFAFLLLFAQGVIAFILWIKEGKKKKRFFSTFFIAAVVILASYLPWYSYMLSQAGLKPFWMSGQPWNFPLLFYYTYFGGERLLFPLLVVSPLIYFYYVYKKRNEQAYNRDNSTFVTLLFIIMTIILPVFILWLRSVLYSPVIQHRYLVFILPALFLMVAYGIYLIKPVNLSHLLTFCFLLAALYNVVYRHNFFSFPIEMQYRQAAAYMARGNKTHTVINSVNAWHMRYYMNLYNYRGKVLGGNKYRSLYKILGNAPGYSNVDTFWVVVGFHDYRMNDTMARYVDTAYIKVSEQAFQSITVTQYGRRQKP